MPRGFPVGRGVPTVATSLTVFMNSGYTVQKATINATYTGNIQFYLSADGGSTWEAATNNVEHTFTTTGTDLRWKAVGVYPAEMTAIKVKYKVST